MERSKTLRVRVNEVEMLMVEALADHERRKLSETVREVIRSEVERRGLWPMSEQARQVAEVRP